MACECVIAGWCERHRCQKTEHWHKLCRTRPDYFQLWESGKGPNQEADEASALVRHSLPHSIAVVIICHNYGRFLADCVSSVLSQTRVADEILIIDDMSSDKTRDVATAFEGRGVRYFRVSAGNVHIARKAGFEATQSEALCFLDADDLLSAEYLEQGLQEFVGADVAIVYSDVQYFGYRRGRSTFPEQFDRALLERDNYVHAGSLVRRDALAASRAFELQIDPLHTPGDWFLWRRTIRLGFTARKQKAFYRYRQHAQNWTAIMQSAQGSYFQYAALEHEQVTLFISLSGRLRLWPALAEFLELQQWPHAQTRLVLFDTSQNTEFAATVRDWISHSDYRDVHYIAESVGTAGLADDDRAEQTKKAETRRAMARIYNRLAQLADTDFVWVLEDDIIPPLDACERLLRGFDVDTGSVAGWYALRHTGLPSVWDADDRAPDRAGRGLQSIFGNGFGCVVLRRGLLRATFFRSDDDFDRAFYREVQRMRLVAKVDWSVECEHRWAGTGATVQLSDPLECDCVGPGWCSRHQCDKPAHWHHLCQTRIEYRRLWEMGRGPGQGVSISRDYSADQSAAASCSGDECAQRAEIARAPTPESRYIPVTGQDSA